MTPTSLVFFGEIPDSIGNLTNLEMLVLGAPVSDVHLDYRPIGPIPASLGDLTNLKKVVVNGLEGPPELGNLAEPPARSSGSGVVDGRLLQQRHTGP